jgi:hypothetical protein
MSRSIGAHGRRLAAPSDLTASAQSHHPVQVRTPLSRPPLAEPPPQACSRQPPWPPTDLGELQPAETRKPAAAGNWSAATRRRLPQARPLPQLSWPPADFRGATAGRDHGPAGVPPRKSARLKLVAARLGATGNPSKIGRLAATQTGDDGRCSLCHPELC